MANLQMVEDRVEVEAASTCLRMVCDGMKELIRESLKAREFADGPYSKVQIGAAMVAHDGTVFTGCNVENACYNLGVCHFKNCVRGIQEFQGYCHCEFDDNWDVYLTKPDGSCERMTVGELLPLSFGPEDLTKKKVHTIQNEF